MKGFSHFLGMLLSAAPLVASAQAGGDGLRGTYYDGLNFEHFIQTRRDPLIDFVWRGEKPISGVPAESFTVRWTGWLVPPVTGHYVLHLAVDDGARVWLDNEQLLDEWRGQPLGYYDMPVDLQAGRPYHLRLDYCQYSRDATARLLWERPKKNEPLRTSTWSNLWGLADNLLSFASGPQEIVPTRYLFSQLPTPPRGPADPSPVMTLSGRPMLLAASPLAASSPPPAERRIVARAKPPVARAPVRVSQRPKKRPATTSPENMAAQLLSGQAITARSLYFEQGQSVLLPAVQASLDTLAQVLRRYPALRLEVQGHTDNQGDPTINQQLSLRRAEAVCQYLGTRGVEAAHLRPLGFGGTQPVADNSLLAERPRNRRVVLRPLP